MIFRPVFTRLILIVFIQVTCLAAFAQNIKWAKDGNSFFTTEDGGIVKTELPGITKTTFLAKADFTPKDAANPVKVENFTFSEDGKLLLIYTNSKRVWRLKTKGDYWMLDLASKKLWQLGKSRPASTLMFAKISPDGKKAAYVSERNVYVEDLASGE
ncbi:MAG: DPP IV N-terminal domain-containing protein, partial [Bacteroidota bacterium]